MLFGLDRTAKPDLSPTLFFGSSLRTDVDDPSDPIYPISKESQLSGHNASTQLIGGFGLVGSQIPPSCHFVRSRIFFPFSDFRGTRSTPGL